MHPRTHARTCMCSRDVLYADVSMNTQVCKSVCKCIYIRSHTRSRICSRPHISVMLPAHMVVCYYSLSGRPTAGRRGEQLAITPVPRTSSGPVHHVAVESWRVHAVSAKQQLQKPITGWMRLTDLYTELQSHLTLLENWQAYQFMWSSSFMWCQKSEKRQLFGKPYPKDIWH